MASDLRTILDGWEYEPGKISVRKVLGADGREKIQTRVDLGLLQFEPEHRPDGQRPFGCATMLEYFERRLQQHIDRNGDDDGFVISSEGCRDLRHEAHQFYQRYLSYFVLEEFGAVARDTEHNLRTIELCARYGETEHDCAALESQRAYVMMMHARARTYQLLQRGDHDAALRILRNAIHDLREMEGGDGRPDCEVDATPEIQVLIALRDDVYRTMPTDSPARLRRELQEAIEIEDYERAAQIRDQLNARRPTASC